MSAEFLWMSSKAAWRVAEATIQERDVYSMTLWAFWLVSTCSPGTIMVINELSRSAKLLPSLLCKVWNVPIHTCSLLSRTSHGMSKCLSTAISRKKLIWEGVHFLEISMALCLLNSNNAFHLSAQSCILSTSAFRLVCTCCRSLSDDSILFSHRVESSAYRNTWFLHTFTKSLVKTKNSRGPRMEPEGTGASTDVLFELCRGSCWCPLS